MKNGLFTIWVLGVKSLSGWYFTEVFSSGAATMPEWVPVSSV